MSFNRAIIAGDTLRYGVREHAMGGILNGLAITDGIIPYGGTFFVFSDYMRGSIRLACIIGHSANLRFHA